MKLDVKSLIIGLVLGIILVSALGANNNPPWKSNKEVFKNTEGYAIIIDKSTNIATRVYYAAANPPAKAVRLP